MTLVRGKIHLPKVEHCMLLEGHLTLNKDEYQKFVQLKFRLIFLEYHNSTSVF